MYNKKLIELNLNKKYHLTILKKTASTNSLIKNSEYSNHSILIAECQTNGVGRTGKSFESSKKLGLYMSIKYSEEYLKEISNITCLVGVAVVRAIERQIKEELKIKWVNDIYLHDKKVCGILVEKHKDSYIIGIGINTYKQKFKDELKDIATSIQNELKLKVNIDKLVIDIIHELDNIILFKQPFMDEYISRSFLIGRTVTLVQDNKELKVVVKSINQDGNLVVTYGNEELIVKSGEVTRTII